MFLTKLEPFDLRYEHCYQDEDLMRQLAKIASRTHPNTMDKVTLQRYRSLLELCDMF